MLNNISELVRITQKELTYESFFPSLRGIACEWKGDEISLYFYNNGPFCEDLKHDYCCLSAEINAQYPDVSCFDEEVIRIDVPLPLPQHAHWAYQNEHASFSSSHPKISARHVWLLKMARCGLESEKVFSWRGLAVDWDEEEIMIHLYYEGEFTTQSSENFQRLCQSISHDCDTQRLYIRNIRCDSPSPLPSHEYWAFLRDAPTLMACEHDTTGEYLNPFPGPLAPVAKGMYGQIPSEEFPSLRGIALAEDQNKTLNVHYYNDGPISQELKEHYRIIGTELLSQSGYTRLHECFVRLDAPEPLPQCSNWLYKNLRTAISSLRPQISLKHKHLIATTQAVLQIKPLPYLRGIAVDWDGPTILMHCYHHRELAEKEKQRFQAFGKEILSHYPVTHLDQRILYVHALTPLPGHEYWVFKN